MDLQFYVRVRMCEKRVTGKQPIECFNIVSTESVATISTTICLSCYVLYCQFSTDWPTQGRSAWGL